MGCCFSCCGEKPPGYDRKPTEAEQALPPDKRPWTEYDSDGTKQKRPEYKAAACRPLLLCGPVCCIFELQWCQCCGEDADRTCDVCCRCQTNRLKMCLCCGPQCDQPFCTNCCDCCSDAQATGKVTAQECCECDCFDCCRSRYSGCQFCCCHCTAVGCPPCCKECCCCQEEQLFMDGDLKPLEQPVSLEMDRA